MALTPKQEKFAQGVAEGKTQADAYRAAYNVRPTTKPETVVQAASRIMSDSNVSARVEELRAPIIADCGITLRTHLTRLENLSLAAEKQGNFGAAVSAEIARGKASGVSVEKSEQKTTVTKKAEDLTDDELAYYVTKCSG